MGKNRSIWVGSGVAAVLLLVFLLPSGGGSSPADPNDAAKVRLGRDVYTRHCAACHGAQLEGQPKWRERLPNGRLPAPPHDRSGHTWHHSDAVLFSITRDGLVPGHTAPPGYESDMPAYKAILSDQEIWAVLAYIKSTWPEEIRARQRKISAERGVRR